MDHAGAAGRKGLHGGEESVVIHRVAVLHQADGQRRCDNQALRSAVFGIELVQVSAAVGAGGHPAELLQQRLLRFCVKGHGLALRRAGRQRALKRPEADVKLHEAVAQRLFGERLFAAGAVKRQRKLLFLRLKGVDPRQILLFHAETPVVRAEQRPLPFRARGRFAFEIKTQRDLLPAEIAVQRDQTPALGFGVCRRGLVARRKAQS